MMARRRAAIDRDGGTLDVARAIGAQEEGQRRNVLGLAEPAHVAFGQRLGAQLVDRPAQGRRALPAQLVLPLGVGITGMNDVDVDIIAITELRQALGKVTAALTAPPIKNSASGVRAAPPTILTTLPWRSLQQRPEQAREPHAAEEFQREAVEPDRIGQFQERARARCARVVDEHVATLEALVGALEQLLARLELAQIAGDGERRRPLRRDRLGGGGEILLGGGGQHGLRTHARECERDAAADPAGGPRNDDDHAVAVTSRFPYSLLARRYSTP